MNVFAVLNSAISGQPDSKCSATTEDSSVVVNQHLDEKADRKTLFDKIGPAPTALGRFWSSNLFDVNLIRVIGEHLGLVCTVSRTSSKHTTVKYLMADKSLSIHICMEEIVTVEKKGSRLYPTRYLFDIQDPLISHYAMARIPDLHIGITEAIPLQFALKLLAIHNMEHYEELRMLYKN